MNILELENKPLAELRSMAKEFNVSNALRMKKEALILGICQAEAAQQGIDMRGGILEIMSEGIGFLRSARYNIGEDDVYVSQAQLRRYEMRSGDLVIGHVRPPLVKDQVEAGAQVVPPLLEAPRRARYGS